MSHNISHSVSIDKVFVSGAPARHNLGVYVKAAQTWHDAMRLAHLDWPISKNQIINPFTNDLIPQYMLIRDDTKKYLLIVGVSIHAPLRGAT